LSCPFGQAYLIVFVVFNGFARIMLGKSGFDFLLCVFVTGNQRPVGIRHSSPTRAGDLAINQLAVWSIFNQELVDFSTDNAAVLFWSMCVFRHRNL
jgi:hypothetical protein